MNEKILSKNIDKDTADLLTKYDFAISADHAMLVRVFNIGKRTIKIIPILNKLGKISSLQIIDSKRKKTIYIDSGKDLHAALKDVPVVCLDTVINVVASTFGIDIVKREQSLIIKAICGVCKKETTSFYNLKHGCVCSTCFIPNRVK